MVAKNIQLMVAEALGTAILVFGGCGAVLFAGDGTLAIAVGFGLSAMLAILLVGPVSGGHINPAVTIGLAIAGKFHGEKFWYYLGGQFLGGIVGSAILWALMFGRDGFDMRQTEFATNGFRPPNSDQITNYLNLWSVILVEIVLTTILMLVVLAATREGAAQVWAPVQIGLYILVAHLVAIGIDGTSINPARSLGPAVFKLDKAIEQVWVFLVFPVVGAAIGAGIWRYLSTSIRVGPATELPESPPAND